MTPSGAPIGLPRATVARMQREAGLPAHVWQQTALGVVAKHDHSMCRREGDAFRESLPAKGPREPWTFPIPGGYITDLYGWRIRPTTGKRQFHEGLDIGSAQGEGASIIAPADGKIALINQDPTKSSGRYIEVLHDDGWRSLHLHILTPAVSLGARVSRGERIALMGKTGQLSDGRPAVTGPHDHMIVKDPCGNVVDPLVCFKGSIPKKGGGSVRGRYPSFGIKEAAILAVLVGGLWWFTQARGR